MLEAKSDKLAKRDPALLAPLSKGTGLQCTPYKKSESPAIDGRLSYLAWVNIG